MTWQPAAILYPYAEEVFAGLLRDLLAMEGETVWVGSRLPATRPQRAVQVIRDGGGSANLRDRARMRVLVWDKNDDDVTDLARLIVALVPRMPGNEGVLRTEHLSGPYEIPDAAPKRYLLFDIHYRGEALT